MNVEFQYLYRDSGNYKNCGSIVFKSRSKNIQSIDEEIRQNLIDGQFFVAKKLNVPELFLRTIRMMTMNGMNTKV